MNTPIAMPNVIKVTTWIARIQSDCCMRRKFDVISRMTMSEMMMPLLLLCLNIIHGLHGLHEFFIHGF